MSGRRHPGTQSYYVELVDARNRDVVVAAAWVDARSGDDAIREAASREGWLSEPTPLHDGRCYAWFAPDDDRLCRVRVSGPFPS